MGPPSEQSTTHWHPDEDAAESAAATRARDPLPIIHSRTARPRNCPSTWCWGADRRQYHSHPDEDAGKITALMRAWNSFPNMSSRTERGRLRKKVGNNKAHSSNECFCAHVMSKTAPSSNIAQRTHSEPTWAKNFAKILRRLDRAWAAAPRSRTTLRLSDP